MLINSKEFTVDLLMQLPLKRSLISYQLLNTKVYVLKLTIAVELPILLMQEFKVEAILERLHTGQLIH